MAHNSIYYGIIMHTEVFSAWFFNGKMRAIFFAAYIFIILALALCAWLSGRSEKSSARSVRFLLLALIPPVLGNLIIINSANQIPAEIGYYVYFLGMDLTMFALLGFTLEYCGISWKSNALKYAIYALLVIDVVQYAANPFLGHAFGTEMTIVDGFEYYRLLPYIGQVYHRIIDYGIYLSCVVIFIAKLSKANRFFSEKYGVILTSMIIGGAWQSYYIFSGTPIDTSMVGFAYFGLSTFYFALHFRYMRLLDSLLADVVSDMTDYVFFFDDANHCIWANQSARKFAGIDQSSFASATDKIRAKFGDLGMDGEWCCKRETGSEYNRRFYQIERRLVTDKGKSVNGSVLVIRDNTKEQRKLELEAYNARHDKLTGLMSKEYLYESIRERLESNPETPYCLCYVDIKDFKLVNDVFGSEFGDYALQCVANHLRKGLSPNCVYGRIAGDTFGILMPESEFDPDRIEEDLSTFKVVRGNIEHHILMHFGVNKVTGAEQEVPVLFDRAHLALSVIEDVYQKHIAYYDDDMRDRVLWNQHVSMGLREAIKNRDLRPYLQPMVDAEGRIVGAEALVRWISKKDGLLPPSSFIPVFEKNGMIAELDRYMWRSACEILSEWKEKGIELFISVNISPKDFYFMDVEAEIKSIVEEFGVDPAKLRLEITETVMMSDVDNRLRILEKLKANGFMVEMDDFGSGYSSLNLLKDMPVDVLKIDMNFIEKTKHEDKAQAIVNNVIRLSDELGIYSLTEGVETEEQYRMLAHMGCKLFQGYFFSKPMPVDEFYTKYCNLA